MCLFKGYLTFNMLLEEGEETFYEDTTYRVMTMKSKFPKTLNHSLINELVQVLRAANKKFPSHDPLLNVTADLITISEHYMELKLDLTPHTEFDENLDPYCELATPLFDTLDLFLINQQLKPNLETWKNKIPDSSSTEEGANFLASCLGWADILEQTEDRVSRDFVKVLHLLEGRMPLDILDKLESKKCLQNITLPLSVRNLQCNVDDTRFNDHYYIHCRFDLISYDSYTKYTKLRVIPFHNISLIHEYLYFDPLDRNVLFSLDCPSHYLDTTCIKKLFPTDCLTAINSKDVDEIELYCDFREHYAVDPIYSNQKIIVFSDLCTVKDLTPDKDETINLEDRTYPVMLSGGTKLRIECGDHHLSFFNTGEKLQISEFDLTTSQQERLADGLYERMAMYGAVSVGVGLIGAILGSMAYMIFKLKGKDKKTEIIQLFPKHKKRSKSGGQK